MILYMIKMQYCTPTINIMAILLQDFHSMLGFKVTLLINSFFILVRLFIFYNLSWIWNLQNILTVLKSLIKKIILFITKVMFLSVILLISDKQSFLLTQNQSTYKKVMIKFIKNICSSWFIYLFKIFSI